VEGGRLGACLTNDALAAAALCRDLLGRHLVAILSLTKSLLGASKDRKNLLGLGRPRSAIISQIGS